MFEGVFRESNFRVSSVAGPEALSYDEAERPRPGRGEALVELFSGIDYLDVRSRTGRRRRRHSRLIDGSEGAGVVPR